MDGLTGGNSDSEAITELSRKQCLEIYTKAKKEQVRVLCRNTGHFEVFI